VADSTTNIDTISSGQAQKEVTANAYFDASSIITAFGRRASTSSGLAWGYYGIGRWYINATATAKANTFLAVTGSSTRYASVNRALTVSEQLSVFAPDKLALYKLFTSASAVTSYEDHRDLHHFNRFLYGRVAVAMGDANVTLTYEQAMCESLEFTGALTAVRQVIVPLVPRDWRIYNNTSGSPSNDIQIVSTGSPTEGILIGQGKRAIVECDGSRIVRLTPDV